MGKPYKKELKQLEKTYQWALKLDTSSFSKFIERSWYNPLISVGSGGSLAGAEFQAYLHRRFFSSVSQAITPMELALTLPNNGEAWVNFLSASGNNIDVYRGFKHTALHETKFLSGLICNTNSKVSNLSKKYQFTRLFEFSAPFGKDGFLATNSLLTFFIVLYRGYLEAVGAKNLLPPTLQELIDSSINGSSDFIEIKKKLSGVLDKQAIHFLYGNEFKPIAVDIESRFVEAGLSSIHIADFRNFAHGRHNWFDKKGFKSGIISFSAEGTQELSERTLSLLPKDIEKAPLSFRNRNGAEIIAALICSMYFTNWLGDKKNIDPGKPGVPNYGSKIYRLSAKSGFVSNINRKDISIERKQRLAPIFYSKKSKAEWEVKYTEFLNKLGRQVFSAVVLDYDGTAVDSDRRYSPPTQEIVSELVRLLKNNVLVGFATGRGKSIREDLKKVIPKELHEKVLIGYYNGGEIKKLSNNSVLECSVDTASEDLENIQKFLSQNIFLKTLAGYETRKRQLTIKNKTAVSESFLWDLTQDQLYSSELLKGEILRSSHSIDIIAKGVSKLTVIDELRKKIPENTEILTIGDRGKWPGNDARLLNTQYSLSVDEVSYSEDSSWNICPAGFKGAQGTQYYLSRLKLKSGKIRFLK